MIMLVYGRHVLGGQIIYHVFCYIVLFLTAALGSDFEETE